MNFSEHESIVLNRIQHDIPINENPFSSLSSELGIEESAIIEIIRRLKERRVVRNIAGIFEPSSLGYSTTLVAMKVPEGRIGDAAALINAHPGISHNYLRDHEYNLWFTIAEESDEELRDSIKFIAEHSGATDHIAFKSEEKFKIGLKLNVSGDDDAGMESSPLHAAPVSAALTEKEKESILLLQRDLPLEHTPFRSLIESYRSGITAGDLLSAGTRLKESGIMRRYSAVIRPVPTGFKSNAMTVWKPGSREGLDRAVSAFRKEPRISHLYLRSVYPGKWEYPLFAMVHARIERELDEIITKARCRIGRFRLPRAPIAEGIQEGAGRLLFAGTSRQWERKSGI